MKNDDNNKKLETADNDVVSLQRCNERGCACEQQNVLARDELLPVCMENIVKIINIKSREGGGCCLAGGSTNFLWPVLKNDSWVVGHTIDQTHSEEWCTCSTLTEHHVDAVIRNLCGRMLAVDGRRGIDWWPDRLYVYCVVLTHEWKLHFGVEEDGRQDAELNDDLTGYAQNDFVEIRCSH